MQAYELEEFLTEHCPDTMLQIGACFVSKGRAGMLWQDHRHWMVTVYGHFDVPEDYGLDEFTDSDRQKIIDAARQAIDLLR